MDKYLTQAFFQRWPAAPHTVTGHGSEGGFGGGLSYQDDIQQVDK